MLYSDAYIKQLKQLHTDASKPKGFGGKVKDLGKFYLYLDKWQPNTLIDYGCGKGVLLKYLKERYTDIIFTGYDPAVNEYSILPQTAFDCVFSNDVLEHIEPQFIDNVIINIDNLSLKYIWLRIDTMPARKFLLDGRNAHLILESENWWKNKIEKLITGNIVYSNLNKKGKLDFAISKEII